MTLIQREWNSSRILAFRIANLSGTGTGLRSNAGFFLTGDAINSGVASRGTVHDDNNDDKLTGSSGMDWVFLNEDGEAGSIADKLTDGVKKSTVVDIDFLSPP